MEIAILVIAVILVLFVIGVYNKLISLKVRTENAWSQIDTQLKRRFDLIPNLVETIKGYAAHEQETLEKVIQARNEYLSSGSSVKGSAAAEGMLENALGKLFALAEAYPDLKANENFKGLQIELTGTEDKIAYARQFYNDTVQKYNESLMIFPNNVVIVMFGKNKFEKKNFFEIENAVEKEAVKVSF